MSSTEVLDHSWAEACLQYAQQQGEGPDRKAEAAALAEHFALGARYLMSHLGTHPTRDTTKGRLLRAKLWLLGEEVVDGKATEPIVTDANSVSRAEFGLSVGMITRKQRPYSPLDTYMIQRWVRRSGAANFEYVTGATGPTLQAEQVRFSGADIDHELRRISDFGAYLEVLAHCAELELPLPADQPASKIPATI